MRSSAIFNYKYYWSCACSKCTITFRFKNLKNKTKTEIIHIQIVHKEIQFFYKTYISTFLATQEKDKTAT